MSHQVRCTIKEDEEEAEEESVPDVRITRRPLPSIRRDSEPGRDTPSLAADASRSSEHAESPSAEEVSGRRSVPQLPTSRLPLRPSDSFVAATPSYPSESHASGTPPFTGGRISDLRVPPWVANEYSDPADWLLTFDLACELNDVTGQHKALNCAFLMVANPSLRRKVYDLKPCEYGTDTWEDVQEEGSKGTSRE